MVLPQIKYINLIYGITDISFMVENCKHTKSALIARDTRSPCVSTIEFQISVGLKFQMNCPKICAPVILSHTSSFQTIPNLNPYCILFNNKLGLSKLRYNPNLHIRHPKRPLNPVFEQNTLQIYTECIIFSTEPLQGNILSLGPQLISQYVVISFFCNKNLSTLIFQCIS